MADAGRIRLLYQQAEQCMYQQNYETAVERYTQILQLDGTQTKAMDAMAEAFLDIGMPDQAKEVLVQSVKLKPNEGASKYLNLGQILEGREAVGCYEQGIRILSQDLQSKHNRGPAKLVGVKQKIVAAHCAIAELFMTDLCDEEDAERQCDVNLQSALQLLPDSPEALQILASFRISQQNNPAALQALMHSYNSWKDVDVEEKPSIELRVGMAKLMLELQQFETAAELLESLLDEDDNISEIWFLLAFSLSHFDIPASIEPLNQCKQLLQKQNVTAPAIVQQVQELEAKITAAAAQLPPEAFQDDAGDADDVEMDDQNAS